MAELPDLTVFASKLNRLLKNETLHTLDIRVATKLNVSTAELKKKLENQKLKKVERIGKSLQFHFGDNEILGLHLMLKGELKELDKGELAPKNCKLIFHFTGEKSIVLTDTLKQATPTLNPPENKIPDALAISQDDFFNLLSNRSKRIKELLMDQKSIRGIGNSYADEILWNARISPVSTAKAIPETIARQLYISITEVLKEAIKEITQANKDKLSGEMRDFMRIHGSGIKKSPTGHLVKSLKIGGRTAYFTAEQKLYS